METEVVQDEFILTPEEIEYVWRKAKETRHPMEYIFHYDYLNKLYQQQTGSSLKY